MLNYMMVGFSIRFSCGLPPVFWHIHLWFLFIGILVLCDT